MRKGPPQQPIKRNLIPGIVYTYTINVDDALGFLIFFFIFGKIFTDLHNAIVFAISLTEFKTIQIAVVGMPTHLGNDSHVRMFFIGQ